MGGAHWELPVKVCYPATGNREWQFATGCDTKKHSVEAWSYHNGVSWPVLLWIVTAACMQMEWPHMARGMVEVAEERLVQNRLLKHYDGSLGLFVGKQAPKNETWSISGYLSGQDKTTL